MNLLRSISGTNYLDYIKEHDKESLIGAWVMQM